MVIAPVVDARSARVEEASAKYSVQLFADSRWDRPVPAMVDAVLRREIEDSGVFARVAPEAGPDMCLLRTQLLAFDVGVEEHVSMRRSFAEVRLAVRVEGPIGADGTRPVLLE